MTFLSISTRISVNPPHRLQRKHLSAWTDIKDASSLSKPLEERVGGAGNRTRPRNTIISCSSR